MDKRKDRQDLPHIEEGLEMLFTAPGPNPAFISELEDRLLERGAELAGQQTRPAPALRRLWDRLVQSFTGRRRGPAVPATRLGRAALALVLRLVVGTVAYAAIPVLSRVFQMDAGLRQVEQADLVQELHLSQTVDGVTVTLERAYADANRIVVGYTIKDPGDRPYHERNLTLTDAAGTVFSQMVGYGVSGQSDILKVALPPGEEANVLSFDAAPVEGTPAELDLRLEMELEERVLPTVASEPPPTPDSRPSEASDSVTVVEVQPLPAGESIGSVTFDFSVPFIPGRVIDVHRTVEAAGVAVRLERVVVTPSETRAYLRFDPSGGVETRWTPIALLQAPGDEKSESYFAYSINADPPVYPYGFRAPLYERQGEWTLAVTELVGTELVPPYKDVRLAGPWVFHFRVP